MEAERDGRKLIMQVHGFRSILYMPKGEETAHANQQCSSVGHFLIFQIPRKQPNVLQPTAAAATMADSSRIHANLSLSLVSLMLLIIRLGKPLDP